MSVFFSAVQYTRLQYFTGIRYLMAIVPILYVVVAVVLVQIPKFIALPLALISLIISWSIAMVRSQLGIFDSVMRVFLEGFQLPWMGTLSRMATQYIPQLEGERLSALPFMAVSVAVIYGIWAIQLPSKPMAEQKSIT